MAREIVLEAFYPYPPERVWQAVATSEGLAAWFCPNNFKPEVGHKFQFVSKPQAGWNGIMACEVQEITPPSKIVYTFGSNMLSDTLVTWTLEAAPGGTKLRLEHTGFKGLGALLLRPMLKSGWRKHMNTSLRSALERNIA